MNPAILFAFLILVGCTDNAATVSTLRKAGFTDIQTTGWEPFACDDQFVTGFRARNPRGEMVSGVVCCGFLKNCTVRW